MLRIVMHKGASPGIEPGLLTSEARVLTVTPRGQLAGQPLDQNLSRFATQVQKCISRESHPGHIDGNDVFHH